MSSEHVAGPRVLVAEDEALIRLDLVELLQGEGYEVVGQAGNGEEAVKLARELTPDLVVMDVKMPHMDGITAASIIAEERIAPVVMLTAFSPVSYTHLDVYKRQAASRMTGVSRSRIAELIESGGVQLNGRVVTKSDRVAAGDMLEVELTEPKVAQVVPAFVEGMRIVHDDADIVVIDKPAGVAAHPSLGWDGPDVLAHLAAAGFRISTSGASERRGIVQRLDVGTSGLMVVAKSEPAYTALKRAFRDRTVEKVYHTLVQGHPDPFSGTIDAPIARHPGHDWKLSLIHI